jgi:hypothetical protein
MECCFSNTAILDAAASALLQAAKHMLNIQASICP